jgi:Flp pilus assembly protein TadD
VGLISLTLLAYSNSLHGAFVFDDQQSIPDNPIIRSLSSFFGDWSGYRSMPNRYVAYATFALNYWIGGLDPTGYHVFNLVVHGVNVLLVYALVRLTFRTPRLSGSSLAPHSSALAFCAAALFATHPLQTQAVTYVVQRLTSLATLFYLATVVLHVRWRLEPASDEPRWRRALAYLPVVATSVLAMKTKEIAFTLPAVVWLYELWFFGPIGRRQLWHLLPLTATALLVPATLLSVQGPVSDILVAADASTRAQATIPRLDYLTTQIAVIATYLRLIAIPVGQNIDHDFPVYRSLLDPPVLASLVVLLSIAVGAGYLHRRASARGPREPLDPAARLASFGVAWFFVTLLVESSVIPIRDVIFEHRVYLPSVGAFMAIAVGVVACVHHLAPRRVTGLVLASSVAVALGLSILTTHRNTVWADDLSLWSDATSKSPGKRRPHYNLGLALVALRREEEAVAEFQAAARADPRSVEARTNLGAALLATGKVDDAVSAFRDALDLAPDHAEANYNLGRVYLMSGRDENAVELLTRTIRARPDYADAYANLAAALNHLHRYDETIRLIQGAGPAVEASPEAAFNVAVAYAAVGDRPAADRQLLRLRGTAPDLANRLEAFLAGTSARPRPAR